jgi:hypothetical protein
LGIGAGLIEGLARLEQLDLLKSISNQNGYS